MSNFKSYQNFEPCEWGWSESEWSESEVRESEVFRSENNESSYNVGFDETGEISWCYNYPNEKLDIIAFTPSKYNTFIKTQKINENFNIICINK
jgi:hypothetical protein